ncbi:DUF726 domain-containing protein [Okeania sp. SIO1I7]|uniref:DUF726 domain-containing protein n=1 Tax=Okeania sp. SIO1I7 TaxID=2607772 RepID=UPI0013F81418|nr:DUF726 domain-containing protein [Okeania sp. SIO1I7]NET24773.1 DUF726 domain-containing protein [Okeania sp. SIO1I7]
MLKDNNQKSKDRIITLRQDENKYAIREEVRGKTTITSSDMIILTHGYNVSEEGAEEAYKEFQKNFNKYSNQLSTLNKAIYWLIWPSNKPDQLDSKLSYFQTVSVAKNCGEKLAEYLKKLNFSASNKQPRIILIGHSLGCRLLLEALKKTIKTNFKLEVFLMAAAVPVSMVQPGQQLNPSISSTEKYRILYSKEDWVLEHTFPIGQMLAGEGFEQAVGFKGNPKKEVWSNTKDMENYTHSDYWKGEKSVQWILSQLGILKTSSRNLKLERPTIVSKSRTLKWRTISERKLSYS